MEHYEFAKWASKILDFLCDYKLDIESHSILPDTECTTLTKHLSKTIPENGEDFEIIFEDFKTKILPGMVHWNHPLNFSSFPSPNSFPSILGDMISIGIGGVGFSWKSCPAMTELESLMIDWYAGLLGLPDCFKNAQTKGRGGGSYQQSNSDAIYNIIIAARHKALDVGIKQCGLSREQVLPNLVLYASEDCHLAIPNFCAIEGITFRAIKTDDEGSISTSELQHNLQKDKENQLIPFLVVATIGSFLKFGVDSVVKIRLLLRDYPTVWLHADGGYGGNAMVLKRYSNLREGLAQADSFAASPHKWLQTAFDSTTLWVRDTREYQAVFVINPVYLQPEHPDAIDYRHYGIALSRRYRGFKTWMTFRIYGKSELELRIRKSVDLADKFAAKLSKIDFFAVVFTRFTFVNFVLKNADDSQNMEFYNQILMTKKMLLMAVEFNGKLTLRFSPTYEYTKEKHIDRAIGILKSLASKVIPV